MLANPMKTSFFKWMICSLHFSAPLCAAEKITARQFNRIVEKQDRGDLEGAIAGYDRVLQLNPKDADAYHNRGLAKHDSGDLDGAIVDYNRAVALRPKYADAFHNRGVAKFQNDDVDGAIADYDRVLEIRPRDAAASFCRGLARHDKGDHAGAIADYNLALELDPTDPDAYNHRGLSKSFMNDSDGAIADYTRALELDPRHAEACSNRAHAHYTKRNWMEALADFQLSCKLNKDDQEYPRVYIWLIQSRQSDPQAANEKLEAFLNRRKKAGLDEWFSKLTDYLLGKASQASLLAAAKSSDEEIESDQLCEAWYYSGMKKLLVGDKVAAADHFRKCLVTEKPGYPEYDFAKAELEALAP